MKVSFEISRETSLRVVRYTPESYMEPTHWHDCIEIGYCLSGRGWFYFGDKQYEVRPGDVFVVNHLERHIAVSDPADPSTYLFVLFEMVAVEQIDPDLTLPFIYHPEQFDNKIRAEEPAAREIGTLMKSLWQEQKEKRTAYPKVMKSLLLLICSLLVRYSREQRGQIPRDRVRKYRMIEPALRFIKQNYREDIQLGHVAKHLALSASRTRHLFYETLGEGFKTYLLHIRVNEAKRLLIHSPLPITDIYLQCGFQSTASFYRIFKKHTGMSPVEYRETSATLARNHDDAQGRGLLR